MNGIQSVAITFTHEDLLFIMHKSYKKPLRWRVVSGICVLRCISPPEPKIFHLICSISAFFLDVKSQEVSKCLAEHMWKVLVQYGSEVFLIAVFSGGMWQRSHVTSHYFELFMSISIALMSRFPSEVSHNVCIVLRLQVLFSSPLRHSFSHIYYFLHFNLSLIHFLHCSADYLISWWLYYSACIAS